MKTCKKLLACLLSVLLLASVVVLPMGVAAEEPAEETIDKYVSLFDLSEAVVGDSLTGTTGLLKGFADAGISTYSGGWNSGNEFDGTQEVVEINGQKAWKIHFDTAAGSSGNYCDVRHKLMVKVAIPEQYIPYVSAVKLSATSNAGFRYCFGPANVAGDQYGSNGWTNASGALDVTKVVADCSYWSGWNGFNGGAATGAWVDSGKNATEIFFNFANNSVVDGGYLLVKDMGIVISGPKSEINSIPVTRKMQLMDLSTAAIDENGVITEYPENMVDYKGSALTKKAVDLGSGKTGMKIDFEANNMTGSGNNKLVQDGGYSPKFGVSAAIPAGYAKFLTKATIKFEKSNDTKICYNFGVGNATYYSRYTDNDVTSSAEGDVTVSYTLAQMHPMAGNFGWWTNKTNFENLFWNPEDIEFVYFVFGAQAASGSLTIKEISFEYVCTDDDIAQMPVTTKYNVFDISSLAVGAKGEAGAMIEGIDACGITKITSAGWGTGYAFDGTQEVVEIDGKKALSVSFGTTSSSSGNYCDIANEYMIKFAIPKSIPKYLSKYISNVTIKTSSETGYRLMYGVTDGSAYGKPQQGPWNGGAVGVTKSSVAPASLLKVTANIFNNGAPDGTWGDTAIEGIFLNFAGTADCPIYILDVTLEISVSPAEEAAAREEYYASGALVSDKESDGTVTEFATSGTKARKYHKTGSYSGSGTIFSFAGKGEFLEMASGVSYWVYNENDVNVSSMMFLDANGAKTYSQRVELPAHSYKKVFFDFSKLTSKNGDDWTWSSGAAVAPLNAEAKAALTGIECSLLGGGTTFAAPVWFDDCYLVFDDIPEAPVINFTADNTVLDAGVTLNDGKIEFASSAEGSDLVAKINVPAGTFKSVSALKFAFNADVAAAVNVVLCGTSDQGTPAHWNYNRRNASWNLAVGANNISTLFTERLSNENFWQEHSGSPHCYNCFNPYNYNSIAEMAPPSSSELLTINSIWIRVFGNKSDEGVDGQKVVLNALELITSACNKVTLNAPAEGTGSVTLDRAILSAGQRTGFMIAPAAGHYVKTITLVDSTGKKVAYAPADNSQGGEGSNLKGYYSFIMPEADVSLTVEMVMIDGTLIPSEAYEGNDFVFGVKVPLAGGQAYDEEAGTTKDLDTYGTIIASNAALEKYGYTVDDLTLELATELKAKGHNLANYMFFGDFKDPEIIKDLQETQSEMQVKFTDVSVEARRSDIVSVSYVKFADGSIYYAKDVNTLDGRHYGGNLVTEFDPDSIGINFSSGLQTLATCPTNNRSQTQEAYDDIFAQGFEHIRMLINVKDALDEDGLVLEENLVKLDKALDCALKAGLAVVIDMHGFSGLGSDENAPAALKKVWHQLAERYATLPNSVAFEIINEPSVKSSGNPDCIMTREQLMAFEKEVVQDIHSIKYADEKYVVLSAETNGYWTSAMNSIVNSGILDEDNIIVDFHHYNPMSFTHSGSANWSGSTGGYESGATEYNDTDVTDPIDIIASFEDTYGVQGWIGEWGVATADPTAKVEYIALFADYAAEKGIGWAIWDDNASFSPRPSGVWNADILEALGL